MLNHISKRRAIGNEYLDRGNYDEAINYLSRTLNVRKEVDNNKFLVGESLYDLGDAFYYKGEFSKALELYNQAADILIGLDATDLLDWIFYNDKIKPIMATIPKKMYKSMRAPISDHFPIYFIFEFQSPLK